MKKSFLIPLIILLMLSFPLPIYAEKMGIGIYPPITFITATQNTPINTTITLSNYSDQRFSGNILFKAFRGNPDGTISLLDEKHISSEYRSLFSSIEINGVNASSNEIALNSKEKKDIILKIPVDKIQLGDYYFTLLYISKDTKSNQTNISIPIGIATNFVLSFQKNPKLEAKIVKFETSKLFTSGPVPFTVLIENTGNQFITPKGTIRIKNMLGEEVGKIDLLPQTILKNSQRYMIDTAQLNTKNKKMKAFISSMNHPIAFWNEELLFGYYTAELHLSPFSNSPERIAQTTFIGFPIFILAALSFVFFIILGIYLRVRRKIKNST